MLSIPIRSTAKYDFDAALTPKIRKQYGDAVAERTRPKLRELSELRTHVSHLTAPSEAATAAIGRYLQQLESLERRFPIETNPDLFAFNWGDAICNGTTIMLQGWRYERASILFNFAALESIAACAVNRSTPEGIRDAGKHFIVAATMFQYIRDHVANGLPPGCPFDLSNPGLTMCMNMMYAQAQKCMFERAMDMKIAETKIAGMIWYCSELYEAAMRAIPPTRPTNFGKILQWDKYLFVQMLVSQASALWHQSKAQLDIAVKETRGYGLEITYLRTAHAACDRAIAEAAAAKVPQGPAEGLRAAVRARLVDAMKDNDTIYMDPIPATSPPIQAMAVAKLGTPFDFSPYAGPDLLVELIDPSLLPFVEEFHKEFQVTLASAKGRMEAATSAARQVLAALHLPGSLEATDSNSGIPDSTWAKIHAVQVRGGIAGLFALAQANAKRASEITVALEKIEKEVADEDASDAQLRSTYGTKWTLMPSAEASRDVKLDIQRYRELLQTAKLTDDTISAKLSSYQAGITQLSGVREALASKVPTANVAGIAEPEKARLRASLLELADIIQQRDALISALTEAGRVPMLSGLLSSMGASRKEEAFAQARGSLAPALAAIDDNISRQDPLLDRVKVENTVFLAARETDATVVARQTALQAFTAAADHFDEIESNLKGGGEFYEGLWDRVRAAADNASGLIAARQFAKQDLQLTIKREAEEAAAKAVPVAPTPAPGGMYPAVPPAPAPGHTGPPGYPAAPYGAYPPQPYPPGPYGGYPPAAVAPPPQFYPPAAPQHYQPHPVAPAPAPAVAASSWTCRMCTLMNSNMSATQCELCGTPRT